MPESSTVRPPPLSSAFVYHWLFWYFVSLPFTVVTLTDRLSRANASWFVTNIHDELGLLTFTSGFVALSQPVFVIVLFGRLPKSRGSDAATKWTLFVLSAVSCVALFLAITGT